ncbi:MAG TPA: M23 family metallopeptidase [Methylomirabilota bacterium]|jgi:murein DD-endopeptidase MepM/ murein hydrolase activator NlpD
MTDPRALLGAVLVITAAAWATPADIPAEQAPGVVILSPYRSLVGANARPRLLPHAGVDIAAPAGTSVLAAADGTVILLIDYEPGCGIGVVLSHPAFRRWTAYCHLTRTLVGSGQTVSRGEPIGLSGTSGNSASIPHVHLELCTRACASHRDGDLGGTQNPLAVVVGCYDPTRIYPADRFVLTWPVPCRAGTVDASR